MYRRNPFDDFRDLRGSNQSSQDFQLTFQRNAEPVKREKFVNTESDKLDELERMALEALGDF